LIKQLLHIADFYLSILNTAQLWVSSVIGMNLLCAKDLLFVRIRN